MKMDTTRWAMAGAACAVGLAVAFGVGYAVAERRCDPLAVLGRTIAGWLR